ncbi:helix-turn-helix domain-containing protein [Pseudomarimonas arenosa]|uniref:CRP-like protein Clp n=1 Tax=Pseudomarimonas arenosa TaxID=2774145 RepID=A0AAW3ZPX0_9GAMM|nr:helix-turn-helix domain-containing protein [Pseudomarimonas arenosa]MBD8527202.1 helix-turn-helix domain-containing protein [Pseudomarimonas arenosa]
MSTSKVINLNSLRKSCGQCSLQELCLGGGVTSHDLETLEDLVKNRRPLQRGDALYRAGAEMHSLFVAREGAFKTVAISESGDEQVIGFHLPGELMGLDGLGNGRHRCETLALEEAQVCEVPFADLERVAAKIPSLQHQLLKVMGRSMNRDHDHLEMLGRRHATERVALMLHSMSSRLEQLHRPHLSFSLSMSREEIASYLGLVIETVSRTFSRLQDEGVIKVQGRKISLLDPERLATLVHEGDERRSTRAS